MHADVVPSDIAESRRANLDHVACQFGLEYLDDLLDTASAIRGKTP